MSWDVASPKLFSFLIIKALWKMGKTFRNYTQCN